MAVEYGFYHLTRTSLPEALAKLLGKVLDRPARALVLCATAECLAALDEALWRSTDPDWLPHGTPADGQADLQPIWLTTEPPGADGAPNAARFLFLVEGVAIPDHTAFDRVLDLFDGADADAVAAARRRYAAVRASGLAPDYHKQNARGGWDRG